MGKTVKVADVIIAVFVILIGIFSFIFMTGGKAAEKAKILIDGEVVSELSLDANGDYCYGEITVRVEDGKIRVISSDCHDKICVNTGWISKKGQSVVCLPERFVILLEGEGENDVVI